MSELKPCPFCGGENLQFIEYKAGYGTVGCCDCCFEYPDSEITTYPKAEAIEAWNTRHERTESPNRMGILSCGAIWDGKAYCSKCGARVKEMRDAD